MYTGDGKNVLAALTTAIFHRFAVLLIKHMTAPSIVAYAVIRISGDMHYAA